MSTARVITERELPSFRKTELDPAKVLKRLPQGDAILLFNEPLGIGKTTLGQGLISEALGQGTHDLVIFVAPTRAILKEVLSNVLLDVSANTTVELKPRPRSVCDELDSSWLEIEKLACAALGKEELCGSCPQFEHCQWPNQLDQIDQDTRLIVLTEQYLVLNPSMVPALIKRSEAERPLVILDEVLFLTQLQTHQITRNNLEMFAETLTNTVVEHELGERAVERWRQDLQHLLDTEVHVDNQPRFFAGGLEHATLAVQAQGRALYAANYRHLVHDLSLLNSQVTTGQWQQNGCFEIAVRVDLGSAQTVVLAPCLDAQLVEERLQRPVTVANPNCVFQHSGTQVTVIRDGIGSARSMGAAEHRRRVVDTFGALTLRNAFAGKRTALVAKKRYMNQICEQLHTLAEDAGVNLHVIFAKADDPLGELSPWEVPLINFGIVGVNTLKDFDAIYTIGSYNITDAHLSGVYNRNLPPKKHHPLRIRTNCRRRQVEASNGAFSSRYHARRAKALHRTLERRVVLQAIGRARPYTSPTEVVILQQDDFEDNFSDVKIFDTLGDFRSARNLPRRSRVNRAALGDRMRTMRETGDNYRSLSAKFNVSLSTVHKALKMPPLERLLAGEAS